MSVNQNSAAFERQLKKIYDCLNIGSNKKAVQEVDRLPKNVKDSTVFQSLKALALIRMGKRRQAFDILEEINTDDDIDEIALQTMTSCYKESVDVARIVDLYEAASSRHPDDHDIMARLFFAYVRVFNFKRQKEIALQMYKTFSQDKRLNSFWAIMSLVMQSQVKTDDGQDTPDKKVCLSLAEKMCEKMIDEERNHEEIELYLMILRKQNKHEEEYRFLTGPICLRLTDHLSWFNRRRAYLCLELKMYSRAFKHYFPTLIQEYPDQIEYYQGLFKSALLLDTEAQAQQQPVVASDQLPATSPNQNSGTPVKSTSALAECYDIVERQCQFALESLETATNKAKGPSVSKNVSRTSSQNPNRRRLLRGPFMARIELFNTIITNESSLPQSVVNQCKNQFSTRHPDFNSLLLDFFQSFSKKIICFYDMDYMLNLFKLQRHETDKLLVDIGSWVEELKLNQSDISEFDLFHVILNYNMLKHALHQYTVSDTRQDRCRLSKSYIDLYDKNRNLGKQANKTEFLPVDHYCLLAMNALMTNSTDLSSRTLHTDTILLTLVVMAENAISNSPSNHQIKLILLKLYSLLGASKQSSDVLLALDIKHFQIDTLGHLLNPVLYNTGNYNLSKESLETCLEFYAHGLRECFEGLVTSYRDARFSKIEEISLVLKRLSDSLNGAQCVLLRGIVSNLTAATIDDLNQACQSFDQFKSLHRMFRCPNFSDKLMDSRDLRVLKSLHFETNQLLQDRQVQTLEDEKLWLRLRYFLIKTVYIQFEHFASANGKRRKEDTLNDVKEIQFGLSEVENLLPQIRDRLANTGNNQYSFLEPEASPFRWTHVKFERLIDLVKPLVFCSDPSSLTQKVYEEYSACLEEMVQDLENRLSSLTHVINMKQTLMSSTLLIEFISLCCTSLVSINQVDSTTTATNSQGAAVNKGQSSQNSTLQQNSKSKSTISQMINKTEAQLTKLSNLLKSIDLKVNLMDKISNLEESLLSNPEHSIAETKDGSKLVPLMNKDTSQAMLFKVKEKLLESYSESFKEFESTCRRKIKLLRTKAA